MALALTRNSEEDRKKRFLPLLFTLFYIAITLFIIFWIRLNAPVEMEEGQGLLVDFGYTEKGLGDEEPDMNNPLNQVTIPSPGSPPLTQEIKEQVLLQDQEETHKMETTNDVKNQKVVVVENVLKSPIKSEKISNTPNNNPETPKTEDKKVNEKAVFTGFKGNGTGNGSQGNTSGQGNMGDESGSKSNNYLGKNTGLGSDGEGRGRIGSGLKDRKLNSIPSIVDNSNKTGKIIVKVKVDGTGKVISSEYSAQGSSITDSDLINKCENAAKKAKFTPSDDKDVDFGTLVFLFEIRN